jgi:predicted deacetylase
VTSRQAPLRLAVALHDVAPQTWGACERLLESVAEIADIPVTLLVAPDYHGEGLRGFTAAYRRALEARLERGDELALHGWSHLDTQPLGPGLLDTLRRTRLTAREGEFAALPVQTARALLERGIEWFDKHGWPLHGFVAPAWLISTGTWQALDGLPFEYTTTLSRLYLLPQRIPVATRTYVYSARSGLRRCLSLARNQALRSLAERASTVRLALHPNDAGHRQIVAQYQRLLRLLLCQRSAVTKLQLARCLREERAPARADG